MHTVHRNEIVSLISLIIEDDLFVEDTDGLDPITEQLEDVELCDEGCFWHLQYCVDWCSVLYSFVYRRLYGTSIKKLK